MKMNVILSLVLALALGAQAANASVTFAAKLTPVGGLSVPGAGDVMIMADGTEINWQVNVTDVVDLSQLQIVDGMGSGSVEGVTLKTLNPPVSGAQNLAGTFDASAVNPAVAGDLNELAGHICMGHIYAAAKMESGQMLMGKLVYVPEEGSSLTCDQAVPGEHTEGATSSSSIRITGVSRSIVAMMLAAMLLVCLS